MPMDTLQAARRGRDGDESAWTTLLAKVREVVLEGLDRRDLPSGYDADDLVAIVLNEVWRSLAAFAPDAPGASFRGWVWTIRQRKLTDLWREARAAKRDGGRVMHTGSIEVATGEPVDVVDPRWVSQSGLFRSQELQAQIDTALASLDEGDREVIRLRETEGLDFKNIAAQLGYQREVTARSRYFRARERRMEAVRRAVTGRESPPRG